MPYELRCWIASAQNRRGALRDQHERSDDHARLSFLAASEVWFQEVDGKDGEREQPIAGINADGALAKVRKHRARDTDIFQVRVRDDEPAEHEEEVHSRVTESKRSLCKST